MYERDIAGVPYVRSLAACTRRVETNRRTIPAIEIKRMNYLSGVKIFDACLSFQTDLNWNGFANVCYKMHIEGWWPAARIVVYSGVSTRSIIPFALVSLTPVITSHHLIYFSPDSVRWTPETQANHSASFRWWYRAGTRLIPIIICAQERCSI